MRSFLARKDRRISHLYRHVTLHCQEAMVSKTWSKLMAASTIQQDGLHQQLNFTVAGPGLCYIWKTYNGCLRWIRATFMITSGLFAEFVR